MHRAMCLIAWLLAPLLVTASDESVRQKTYDSRGAQRTYTEYAPDSLAADTPVPLLIVLHGSGGRGAWMVDQWRDMARQHSFVVVGPDSSDIKRWRIGEDSVFIFRDLVLAVAREHPIDTRRIYLFGQSGGAVYALMLSMLESEFFAATAVHAGSWREPKEFRAIQIAQRKIPIALFVGSRDPYFSMKSVNETAAALKKAGHPTAVTLIPRHDHDYQDVAVEVNRAAWEFMQSVQLPAQAKFLEYE